MEIQLFSIYFEICPHSNHAVMVPVIPNGSRAQIIKTETVYCWTTRTNLSSHLLFIVSRSLISCQELSINARLDRGNFPNISRILWWNNLTDNPSF